MLFLSRSSVFLLLLLILPKSSSSSPDLWIVHFSASASLYPFVWKREEKKEGEGERKKETLGTPLFTDKATAAFLAPH